MMILGGTAGDRQGSGSGGPLPTPAAASRDPATLHLSRAADYLLICHANAVDTDDQARAAYFAALDMWKALTGLPDAGALAYARAIRETRSTAAPVPF